MECVFKVLPRLFSNDEYLTLYLNAIDEHSCTKISPSEETNLCQSITKLLSTSKGRRSGLKILLKLNNWLPIELLASKIHLWTSFILKGCNSNELNLYGDLIFNVLGQFATFPQQPHQLKDFVTNYLSKIYEAIVVCPLRWSLCATKCAQAYLQNFQGASGQYKSILINFFKKFVDIDDEQLAASVGCCLVLIQQVGGGSKHGNFHKSQVNQYMMELIGSLNEIINQMNVDGYTFYADKNVDSQIKFDFPILDLNPETTVRSAELYIRFYNIATYLKIALRWPFPVGKSVQVKKILNLIERGMNAFHFRSNNNLLYDNATFVLLMPSLQRKLLHILNALIHTLRGNLRPYHDTVLSCLVRVLKMTSVEKSEKFCEKKLRLLRIEVYNSISIWCGYLKEGSCCEVYEEELIMETLNDIRHNYRNLLQVRLIVAENPSKMHIVKQDIQDDQLIKNIGHEVYCAALRCLQDVMLFSSSLLKLSSIKVIQDTVIKIVESFNMLENADFCTNWHCRLQTYELLSVLIKSSDCVCPMPMDMILHLLRQASNADPNHKVQQTCIKAMLQIEKLLHPQKQTSQFPTNPCDLQSKFSKNQPIFDPQTTEIKANELSVNNTDNVKSANIPEKAKPTLNVTDFAGKRNLIQNNAAVSELQDTKITDQHETNTASKRGNSYERVCEGGDPALYEMNHEREFVEQCRSEDDLVAEMEAEFVDELKVN